MTLGSTPTMVFHVSSKIDLTELKSIYITFEQRGTVLTRRNGEAGVSVKSDTIEVTLRQEETLAFKPGIVNVQLRGVSFSGRAFATNIAEITATPILLNGVVT